jgi:hypothetical protein
MRTNYSLTVSHKREDMLEAFIDWQDVVHQKFIPTCGKANMKG